HVVLLSLFIPYLSTLSSFFFFFLLIPPPPTSTLFPYTTLFRSSELNAKFIPFSAQSRMSGVEFGGTSIRKGAVESILGHLNGSRSEEHTSELQSRSDLVCRLLLEKKKKKKKKQI